MTHYLKIRPEHFQAVIDGRKPFEVRFNDRNFQVGDRVILEEYKGNKYHEECPFFGKYGDCPAWQEVLDIPGYGEDEAIDICGRNRAHCEEYVEHVYTGRTCTLIIKEIFKLDGAHELLGGFVAFTFDNVEVEE